MIPATCPVALVTTTTVSHSLCHFRYLHMEAVIPVAPVTTTTVSNSLRHFR